jgi:hypothetical protein
MVAATSTSRFGTARGRQLQRLVGQRSPGSLAGRIPTTVSGCFFEKSLNPRLVISKQTEELLHSPPSWFREVEAAGLED